jgi:hypothetical protein
VRSTPGSCAARGALPRRREVDPRALRTEARRVRRDGVRAATAAGGEPDAIGHSAHEVLRLKDFAA